MSERTCPRGAMLGGGEQRPGARGVPSLVVPTSKSPGPEQGSPAWVGFKPKCWEHRLMTADSACRARQEEVSTSPRNRNPTGLPVHISKESHNHRPQSRRAETVEDSGTHCHPRLCPTGSRGNTPQMQRACWPHDRWEGSWGCMWLSWRLERRPEGLWGKAH